MQHIAHPYFAKAEEAYQEKVKAVYLALKDKNTREGNADPDAMLPFVECDRPLPADNNPKDKGNGFNNTRMSPAVYVTTTELAADLPDGRAGIVVGEVFLRYAGELISRHTHRLSTPDEVKTWRAAGLKRQREQEEQLKQRVSRKNAAMLEAEQAAASIERRNAALAEANRLEREAIAVAERRTALAGKEGK